MMWFPVTGQPERKLSSDIYRAPLKIQFTKLGRSGKNVVFLVELE
jgi:hypothetical protein